MKWVYLYYCVYLKYIQTYTFKKFRKFFIKTLKNLYDMGFSKEILHSIWKYVQTIQYFNKEK